LLRRKGERRNLYRDAAENYQTFTYPDVLKKKGT